MLPPYSHDAPERAVLDATTGRMVRPASVTAITDTLLGQDVGA
jgi:hypothetical protein